MEAMNLPISMYSEDLPETIGAPSEVVNKPSLGQTIENTLYGATMEGSSMTIGDWLQTRVVMPYITDTDRPKLNQDKVDQLFASANIPDKAPDANKYNDVAIYYLLDKAKRRQAMREMDEATDYSWVGTPLRATAMLGAGMLDPINLASGVFPAAGAARAIGLAKTAASIEALQIAGQSAPSLLGRIANRVAFGAIEGAVGNVPLEAITAPMRNEMGEDYTAAQSLANLALGSAVGGGIHVVIGGLKPRVDIADRVEAPIIEQPKVAEPTDIKQFTTAKQGADTQVKFGDTYEPAQYVVIDASELDATMKKSANQFRDRTGAASQAQITEIANKLDPNLLMDSPTADSGAPTMAANGSVIAGNGRMAAIKLAYETKKGDGYKQAITQQAQQLGITDDISGMKQPILVRKLTSDKVDVERLAVISNETGAMRMSALEQSKVDSDRIGTLDNIATYDTGEINYNASLENIKAWVGQYPKEMRAALLAKDGTLSLEGQQRYKNAILHKAYGDTPLLAKMIESTDNDIKTVINAAVKLAPRVAIIKDKMQAGALHNLNIDDDLQAAITKYSEIKSAGRTVDNYVQQQSMLDDELSPSAIQLLLFIDKNKRSSRAIADGINNFYDNLENAGNPKQQTMFGDVVPSREQLLVKSLDVTYSAAELTEIVTPQTRENAVTMSVTQLEDNYSPTVDTIINSDPTIGKANFADVKTEVKNSLNLENSYVTRDIPKLEPIAEPAKFEDQLDFDYVGEADKLKAKGDEIQQLSDAGLYSKKQQPDLTPEQHAENFRKQVDDWNSGAYQPEQYIKLGKTPDVFNLLGSNSSQVSIQANVLNKVIKEKHGLDIDVVKQLPEQLNNPVMVLKSRTVPDALVALTELSDKDGRSVIAAIHLNRRAGRDLTVNKITSVYGRNNAGKFIAENIAEGNLLYINKIKSHQWATTQGLQLPEVVQSKDGFSNVIVANEEDLVKYSQTKQATAYTGKIMSEVASQFGDDGVKLLESGKIKIVETAADLPGKHPDNVQGMFKDGEIYLVAKNIDPLQVKGVVLHEVGVHANMRRMLGEKAFNQLITHMDDFLEMDSNIRQVVDAAIPSDTPAQFRAEERLAYLVENMPEHGIVKSLIAKVKAWLYKTFPSVQSALKLNDADIGALALSSLRNYATKNTPERTGNMAMFSRMQEVADTIESDIKELDKIIAKTAQYKTTLESNIDVFDFIDSKADFIDAAENIGLNKNVADTIYGDVWSAYNRALETIQPNPQQYAIDFAIKKLDYGLQAHRVSLLHDRAVKQKLTSYLIKNFASDPKAGIRSLLIGTTLQRENSRAFTAGDSVRNAKRIFTGQLDTELSKAGIRDLYYSGALNDEMQRVMWAIDDGADLKGFTPEAVQASKIVMAVYDNITNTMRQNGMMVNKIKHYLSNQATLHNQTKIRAAGFDNWKADILQSLDMVKTAEAMNIKPSMIDDELLQGIYQGLSTGEHISSGNGSVSEFGNPLRAVRQKQRKLIFKDADSVIAYRNKYGSRDFQSAVTQTIESNARKVGILTTLGVNYERNLKEVASEFLKTSFTPEQRSKLRKFTDNNMINMLKVIDGRADIPFSEGLARFTSNVLAWSSMARLGGATLSAVTDLTNAASYLNRQGMGGTTFNTIELLQKEFSSFSPEKKQIIGSIGIFSDAMLQNAYRDGYLEPGTSQGLSKWVNRFFKITGLDAWTNSARLSAADSLMNYTSGFTKHEFSQLPESFQKTLKTFGIEAEDWAILRQTKQLQADGNHYMVPQELDNIRDIIKSHLSTKGISDKVMDAATDKYIDRLKTSLTNYYHDALSHMIIEPDAATKYYQTWGGLNPGSAGGVIARFVMQFRSFSIGFMRKILFDMYNQDISAGAKAMNIGKYVAATTIMGYVAGAMKDISKGREPRKLLNEDGRPDTGTMTAALLQGGGLGIFGDFVFGEYNRFGGNLSNTLAGPVIGGTLTDLASLYSSVKEGKDVRGNALRIALDNTPFINAFYSRMAVNYLFAYGLQEYLNPGYLRRMERRVERQNNQGFWLPPTSAVQY